MSERRPSSEDAPSAEELKDRVDTIGAETDLGAGNQEPDPATAETPPNEVRAGDKARTQT